MSRDLGQAPRHVHARQKKYVSDLRQRPVTPAPLLRQKQPVKHLLCDALCRGKAIHIVVLGGYDPKLVTNPGHKVRAESHCASCGAIKSLVLPGRNPEVHTIECPPEEELPHVLKPRGDKAGYPLLAGRCDPVTLVMEAPKPLMHSPVTVLEDPMLGLP